MTSTKVPDSFLSDYAKQSGVIVEFVPICPHYTNTQLEKMKDGRCPQCENGRKK